MQPTAHPLRMTDHHGDAADALRQILQRVVARRDEVVPQQQILGRIASDRQLGCDQDIGAESDGAGGAVENPGGVAGDVAEGAIDLCDGDAHAPYYSIGFQLLMSKQHTLEVADSLGQVAPAQWDRLAGPNPLVSHAFLHALHESGSAAPDAGWAPQYLLLRE